MATKLGRWTENHLLFYRELVIPGTEADHLQPPTPATTDLDESRATSQTSSPSRSRSVSMALSGDEDGAGSSRGGQPLVKPKRTGNGQLGKKRGPYRKGVQVQVASYFAPAPQAAPLASNQFVIAQAQGGWVDESGRIRGAGAGLFAPEFQNIVRWWEAGGKRAKTKKELSKIATRRAREEFGATVAADGSRDLREDETLDDVLDALLDAGPERPAIESLPHDYLAGSLGRAYTTATAKGTSANILFSPPAKPAALPEASYGDHFFGERLPEAFSWARSDAGVRSSSPPPAPPPPSRARQRSAAPHDFGVYPYFTPASISPAGLYDNERRDFMATPLPDPRRPASFFSDPLLGSDGAGPGSAATDVEARLDASRSLAAYDEPLRKVVYGGWVGEVYAGSLETFLAETYGEGEQSGSEARDWVERNVFDPMFALEGALPLVRKAAAVIQEAGGLAALDATSKDELLDDEEAAASKRNTEPSSSPLPVKQEIGESDDVVMKAEDEAETLGEVDPSASFDIQPHQLAASLPSKAAIRAMIRRMPVDRAAKAHLDRLGQLPIFLSSVINSPADFYAEPEPISPTTAAKRRRSVVERDIAEGLDGATPPATDSDEPASWAAATLRTVGRELLDLVHEQEDHEGAPRKKTRTSRDDDAGGRWVSEAKATRVRLLLVRPSLRPFRPRSTLSRTLTLRPFDHPSSPSLAAFRSHCSRRSTPSRSSSSSQTVPSGGASLSSVGPRRRRCRLLPYPSTFRPHPPPLCLPCLLDDLMPPSRRWQVIAGGERQARTAFLLARSSVSKRRPFSPSLRGSSADPRLSPFSRRQPPPAGAQRRLRRLHLASPSPLQASM